MEQENSNNKLTKNSRGNGIKSAKGLKNNLLMRSKKETKGITLIALVITIIVLLILAGVAIATLLGDNGIITRATTAKEKTQQAGATERVQVEIQGSYGTDGNIDVTELSKNLGDISGIDGLPISTLPATVTLEGYDVTIKKDGTVTARKAFNKEEWDKTAIPEDCFYWESDDKGEEGYNTIIGYKQKINDYTKLRFPSRCKEIEFSDINDYGDGVDSKTSRAFTNNILKVEIPETVTVIGYSAFGWSGGTSFKNLKEVNIPNSVTSIGDCAFRSCTGLTEIRIPDNVISIGDQAFTFISDNAVFHVVKSSYADTWLSENKYENQTIEYITE